MMKINLAALALVLSISSAMAGNFTAPPALGTVLNPPTATGSSYQLLYLSKPLDTTNGVLKQSFPENYQKPGNNKK